MGAGTVTRQRSSRRPSWRTVEKLTPYTLLVPSVALIFLLLGYPLGKLVEISFQEFTRRQLFNPDTVFTLDNYTQLVDAEFGWVLIRTLVVLVAMVIGTMVLGTAV